MNLRHAAALALVGWYLMVAPSSRKHVDPDPTEFDPSISTNFHAPLSKWTTIGEFDSAAECHQQREKQMKQHLYNLCDFSSTLTIRCVATDDPRLREK
jgi:hypothetical protein